MAEEDVHAEEAGDGGAEEEPFTEEEVEKLLTEAKAALRVRARWLLPPNCAYT